jgi:hypothetical protein
MSKEYCIRMDGTVDSTRMSCIGSAATTQMDSEASATLTTIGSNDEMNHRTKENAKEEEGDNDDDDDDDDDNYTGVPMGCKLVMAPSTIPNGGWGIFSLVDRERGTPIIDGDVVIQIIDFNISNADKGTIQTIQQYFTSAEETVGYYEAINVVSATPGIGMMVSNRRRVGSNSIQQQQHQHNVIPYVPTVDEGDSGLVRTDSPGAGAITHYHN